MWMYHVTNQNVQDDARKPNWDKIEPCGIANDETYDGDLLGLPLASFTTTLILLLSHSTVVDFPKQSPYPRSAEERSSHHRVKVKFNINDYHIFWMNSHTTGTSGVTQIQLLCIRKNDREELEDKIYKTLLQYYKDKELTTEQLEEYFPDGQANVYDSQNEPFFVNVHFVCAIDIHNGEWDTVRKMGTGTGELHHSPSINRNDRCSLWCMKQHVKGLNDAIGNLTTCYGIKKFGEIVTALKSEFDSTFPSLLAQLDINAPNNDAN